MKQIELATGICSYCKRFLITLSHSLSLSFSISFFLPPSLSVSQSLTPSGKVIRTIGRRKKMKDKKDGDVTKKGGLGEGDQRAELRAGEIDGV